MTLINKTIPGLFNGVSQQPPTLRLENQCELQENAYSDLVDGLTKRPGTEVVSGGYLDSRRATALHLINRDADEKYILEVGGIGTNPMRAITVDGTPCTILYENQAAKDYMTITLQDRAIDAFRFVTIADYTMIVNKRVQTAMVQPAQGDPNLAPPAPGLIYVKRGFPETDYKVDVLENDIVIGTASYTTPEAASGNAIAKTTDIAQELYNGLNATLFEGVVMIPEEMPYLTLVGSTIIIENDIRDFTIRVSDSYGNQALQAIKGSVQKFSDLPPEAKDGMTITIEGTDEGSFDDYYVRYVMNKDGAGLWEETVAIADEEGKRQLNVMDASTLPHALRRTGVNEFTLGKLEWSPRLVGNEKSAPKPSFIGNTITDIFFFKNRLGFLSGENVIMSRAGEYFNLFPSTTTDVLDGDPIDISAASSQVSLLRHALPFNNSLLLFSDQQQFILNSGALGILTPATVSINPSTAFDINIKCKPIIAGAGVYFVVPKGSYSSVREYHVQQDSFGNDAQDVSSHVPQYLPKNIQSMAASSSSSTIVVHSELEPKALYVYKYHWEGEEKAQGSWSKWVFEHEIRGNVLCLDNTLYILQDINGFGYLVKLPLDNNPTGSLPFKVHLDAMILRQGIYNEETDRTVWTGPFEYSKNDLTIVDSVTGVSIPRDGTAISNQIRAKGDHTLNPCYIGIPYTMKYRFSKWYVRDDSGIANYQGRLMIRNLKLAYTKTGPYKIIVNGNTKEFSSVILGQSEFDTVPLLTEERTWYIGTKAATADIDIVNDSYLPSKFQLANFEGTWTARSRRI